MSSSALIKPRIIPRCIIESDDLAQPERGGRAEARPYGIASGTGASCLPRAG